MAMCDLCAVAEVEWFCPSEQANLCGPCDAQLHNSNPIFATHERVRVGGSAVEVPDKTEGSDASNAALKTDLGNGSGTAEHNNDQHTEKLGDSLIDFKVAVADKMKAALDNLTLDEPADSGNAKQASQEKPPAQMTAVDLLLRTLQPSFDDETLDQKQFMHLMDLDNPSNLKFVLKIVEWYMQDQAKIMAELHNLTFDAALNDYKPEVNLIKVRFLLHKLRGSSSNAGAAVVVRGCLQMRELCTQGLQMYKTGKGNYKDLKEACERVNNVFVEVVNGLKDFFSARGEEVVVAHADPPSIPDALPA
mmetsp:Transcript_32938/g.63276  ORF Transcript_32938/g.63276 Transcript_32938/m.63276 type:complete len:305 (+) Transcript_32938:142-1056(+)